MSSTARLADYRGPSRHHRQRRPLLAALLLVGVAWLVSVDTARAALPLGVAAGDVTPSSVVLWAYSDSAGTLRFELSTDPDFDTIEITRTVESTADLPSKVGLGGLRSHTRYYYRVTDASGAVAEGRFRTAAAATAHVGLRFGASGDLRGELAPYPALRNAPERQLDFFVLLGDSAYADLASPALPYPAETLDEFRTKQVEVLSARQGLASVVDLRAATAWFATIDDHEVRNNFAGGATASTDSAFAAFDADLTINDTELYDNGLRAFQDFQPLFNWFYPADAEQPAAGERKLYRYRLFGKDAAIFLLDARSLRDASLPQPDVDDSQAEALFRQAADDPARTLLGRDQLQQLKTHLQQAQDAGITWKFVFLPQPIQQLTPVKAADRFEGYAAERDALLAFIDQAFITNVVFVAGDLHGTLVNNLAYRPRPAPTRAANPQVSTGAFEVVTGPVAANVYGPGMIRRAVTAGLLTAQERLDYLALPRYQQNSFLAEVLDTWLRRASGPFAGFEQIGLEGSGLRVSQVSGPEAYVSGHSFGWTEFDIHAGTQELLVTHWAIEPYDADQAANEPATVLARQPAVIGQFAVRPITPCQVDAATVCLYDGRFEVSLFYFDAEGQLHFAEPRSLGRRGAWFSVEPGGTTPDIVLKILDGRTLSGSHWLFAAGLTEVHYQLVVRDRLLDQVRVFDNPRRELLSFADLAPFPQALDLGEDQAARFAAQGSPELDWLLAAGPNLPSATSRTTARSEGCVSDAQQLCLLDRLRVTVTFESASNRDVYARQLSSSGGAFGFSGGDLDTPEVIVKVERGDYGFYNLFVGGLTNRPFTVTFEDTTNENRVSLTNPRGSLRTIASTRDLPQ